MLSELTRQSDKGVLGVTPTCRTDHHPLKPQNKGSHCFTPKNIRLKNLTTTNIQ